jgi:hypothetical protein
MKDEKDFHIEALTAKVEEAERRLNEYAKDALDDLDNWSGYASEYFQEKHDLDGARQKWLDRIAASTVSATEGER